jgi:hypothetical protein
MISLRHVMPFTCAALLVCSQLVVSASPRAQDQEAAKIPAEQLDSLVAPIALYPDNLLSQTLVASTYPMEVMQLYQWLQKNPDLGNDQNKLSEAVKKQPWDPSVQAMAALPDVVKRLADDIQWTTDLGNAVLAQQNDVMDAIQRMRSKAQGTGALASNQQQKVETQTVEGEPVIVIQQADPQVVHVPSYDPTAVYGVPPYPYPLIYYPPTGAVVAARAISFGVGMAMGAAWGGGWGWNCGWGRNNNINVNVNNNFNRNVNVQGGNRVSSGAWQHNPTHRGGTPYPNRNTANRYGGTARGDSLNNRQLGAQQQLNRQGGNLNSGNFADRSGAVNRATPTNFGGSSDRGGNRSIANSPSTANRGGGLGNGSGSFNGSSARTSSDRGASSLSSGSFGGGASRGGGGGGGARGGGGGGRRR